MEDLNPALEWMATNQHRDKLMAVITNACAEFDHHDELQHNVELQNFGAANILTKFLAFLSSDTDIHQDEILRMVCAATEMVFRAQTTFVHVAFDQCGAILLPNLLRILELAEQGQIKHAGTFLCTVCTLWNLGLTARSSLFRHYHSQC